jgi:hypothetical protein
MFFTLSAGDTIHIGDAVTVTVLAVEGDLIRLGLETPQGGSLSTGSFGKGGEQPDLKRGWNRWEFN